MKSFEIVFSVLRRDEIIYLKDVLRNTPAFYVVEYEIFALFHSADALCWKIVHCRRANDVEEIAFP